MSVKDDAMTAVHAAMIAASSEVQSFEADLAVMKASVEAKGNQLLQSKALADALKLSHAALTGTTSVAPMAANAVGFVQKWAMPGGAVLAAAAAYAHWGLKLF